MQRQRSRKGGRRERRKWKGKKAKLRKLRRRRPRNPRRRSSFAGSRLAADAQSKNETYRRPRKPWSGIRVHAAQHGISGGGCARRARGNSGDAAGSEVVCWTRDDRGQ